MSACARQGYTANSPNVAARRIAPAIKPVILGGKNFLCAGSGSGADGEVRADAMTVTAKLSGLNPEVRITDTLGGFRTRDPRGLDALPPSAWKTPREVGRKPA